MCKIYVQYGCGFSSPEKWRNFDASPTLRFEKIPLLGKFYKKNKIRFPDNVKYGDILKGLPVADHSCQGVYCSHILEHLALEELRMALANTYRMLLPGGYFRFVLPDLEYYIKSYVNDPSPDASLLFMKNTSLGITARPRGLTGFIKEWLGNSRHLWMWDYKSLEQELNNIGFVDIRRAEYGDASDSMFSDIEDYERWENCLGIECRHP